MIVTDKIWDLQDDQNLQPLHRIETLNLCGILLCSFTYLQSKKQSLNFFKMMCKPCVLSLSDVYQFLTAM